CFAFLRGSNARSGWRHAAGWNGRTAPSRTRSPRRIPSSCAGRNSMRPGVTSWRNGITSMRHSTCCNSACGAARGRVSSSQPRRAPSPLSSGCSSTHANAAFLSPAFLDEVLARYAGTRLGRQEIDGEVIEDRADSLWTRAMIEAARVRSAPPLLRIVIGVDPPGTARPGADACGIVAAGIAENGIIYVLADATVQGLAPQGWASTVVALFTRLRADMVIAEVNLGGDMVRSVLQQIDPA